MEGKGLYTWIDWQKKADAGAVNEPRSGYLGTYWLHKRPSNVECPNTWIINGRTHYCRARLSDLEFVIECGSLRRRPVICEVCGWMGCRAVGYEPRA